MKKSNNKPLTIRIGVGGRFHADQLALALTRAQHNVFLHTSLPRSRFLPLPDVHFSTHVFSEALYRMGSRLGLRDVTDHYKMGVIGRSLLGRAADPPPDVLVAWSSFGLEAFRQTKAHRILVRDSSHIEYQTDLLSSEYQRLGLTVPRRQFCIDRELEEYELADSIVLLSDFAKKSFQAKGFPEDKLAVVPLGVDTTYFPQKRYRPVQLPVQAVFFGTIGVRKGVHYLLEATRGFSKEHLELHLVGPVEPGFDRVLASYDHYQYHKAKPHRELAPFLTEMDLFLFPTLEDGFGQTLLQAMSVGLVPVSTPNCGAAECITHGKNGYIVPAGTVSPLEELLDRIIQRPEILDPLQVSAEGQTWENYHARIQEIVARTRRQPLSFPRQAPTAQIVSNG